MSRPAEDSLPVRGAVLATVLIAVAGVAVQEEFAVDAVLAAGAICLGSVVSYVRRRKANWWLKLLIAAAVLIVARGFFISLLANPYDPRISLVRLFLWLQALHSFDLPARRDLKYSLASAVVLIAVAAVYTREMTFGALLLAFALSASVTLVVMRPAPPRTLSPRATMALGSVVAGGAVISAALLFAVVPRSQGLRVQWMPVSPRFSAVQRFYDRVVNPAYPAVGDRPGREPPVFNPAGYIGFSSSVDLRLRGILDDTLVMRVRATRAAFWRGLAFDEYTGIGWRMSDGEVEEYTSADRRVVPRLGPDETWPSGSEAVVQTFYVEVQQPNVVFAAYRPMEVYFPAGTLGVDRFAGLRSPVPLEQGLIYSVISRAPNPAPAQLRAGRFDIPEGIRARYLPLPSVPSRVVALARHLTAGLTTQYESAQAINRYLVANYRYDLQAPPLPAGADAVDYFLFTSRRGSCETFASAMTVLLRAAGIPARLVTGYASGTYNFLTGYHEVRNSDAHAWVEAFLPRAGWIEFEPTPGFDAPEVFAARTGGQWLMGDAVGWAVRRLGSLGSWSGALVEVRPPLVVPAALVLAVLVAIRRRNGRTGTGLIPQVTGIEDVYAKVSAALTHAGLPRPPHVTPREYAAAAPPSVQAPLAELTGLFEQVRYGRHIVVAEEETHARGLLDEVMDRLAAARP